MPDNQPIRIPPTAQVVESPPRRQASPADPCAMVIFGAGGDLTKRLVMPALYNLSRTKVLPEKFALIGVDLAEGTAESWRDHLYDMLKSFVGNAAAEFDIDQIDEAAWKRLAEKMSYVQGDLTKPELYEKIRGALGEAEKTHGTQGNVIFYLAVADRFFGTVVEQLGKAKLTDQDEDKNGKHRFWRRVVIEKPFGHSLDSARELNARILRTLHEDQIFRIDHFLGKDTVQKHHGVPFRQWAVRTDLEPRPDRSRADHRGGDGGRGAARQVLRGDRGAARHGPEPRVHACFRWWPWSRRRASMPPRSARRRPKCSPRCPPSSRHGRCAASMAPARCWARR